MTTSALPQSFVWRRLHSLMGLWLVLFLIEHLLVNSQAALLLGDNARGFIDGVNAIHNLPYLEAIEIFLLGVPILIHMVWGIKYLLTSKYNSGKSDGSTPSLEYGRNKAYTWQRITSWILVVAIIGHVVKFRFLEYPHSLNQGEQTFYFVRVHMDNGLYTVAERLGVKIYDQNGVMKEKLDLEGRNREKSMIDVANRFPESSSYDAGRGLIFTSAQDLRQNMQFVEKLEKISLSGDEVIAVSKDFGTASLLTVRDTFKNWIYVGLYTAFVLAACFHAFNGFWTFLITWGVILKMSAQRAMVKFAIALMLIVTFLGLAAIWGTYWLNLRS